MSIKRLIAPKEERPRVLMHSISVGKQIAQAQERFKDKDGDELVKEFKNKSMRNQKYVFDALTQRLNDPSDQIKERQELHGTLNRQMIETPLPGIETHYESRLVDRKDYLLQQKNRHKELKENYKIEKENIRKECEESYRIETEKFQRLCQETEELCNKILAPVETDTDDLGERSQEYVQGLIDKLLQGVERRKEAVDNYHQSLQDLEAYRNTSTKNLLTNVATEMIELGHLLHGEAERWCEKELRPYNRTALKNSDSGATLQDSLTKQVATKRKDMKIRWHNGVLLWKKMRHHHALKVVLDRIASREFEHPVALELILERLRDKQDVVFTERIRLVDEMFEIEIDELKANAVANLEEQINVLNERTQEEYDNLFVEVKEIKDTTHHQGDSMLNKLRSELELYDAKSEWKEHDSVRQFVDIEVKPKLDKVFIFIDALFDQLAIALETLDENQHHASSKMISFGTLVSNMVMKFKQNTKDFDFNHNNDVETCIEEFQDLCTDYEKEMDRLHLEMNDAAHLQDAESILQQIFDQLEVIEKSYRSHAADLTKIHRDYPGEIVEYFAQQTDIFVPAFGLSRVIPIKEGEEEAPAEPPAAEEGEEAPPPRTPVPWEDIPMYSYDLLVALDIDEFRTKVIPPINNDDKPKTTPEDGGEAPPVPADGGEEDQAEAEEEKEKEEERLIPRCADGTESLSNLFFEAVYLDNHLIDIRKRTFLFIQLNHDELAQKARITLSEEEENISTLLNQRLRSHGNRQGTVQVEWFQPRKSEIEKHKIKFERHLISIAQKHAAHEDQFEQLLASIDVHATEFQEKLEVMKEKIKAATLLNELTACERRARKDILAKFQATLADITETLQKLSTKAPQDLEQQNKAFLLLCKASSVQGTPTIDTPVELYSHKEMEFYSGELDILNEKLREKSQARLDQLEELEKRKEVIVDVPFNELLETYQSVKEVMEANNGLGLLGRKNVKT